MGNGMSPRRLDGGQMLSIGDLTGLDGDSHQ